LYYDERWQVSDAEHFAARQRQLAAGPTWIIDGNYLSTMPIRLLVADTVIFLDLPGWRCLIGVAQRRLRYRGGQDREHGVFDRISWAFVKYIWWYRRDMAPKVRALIEKHGNQAQIVVLRSRRSAMHFVAQSLIRASSRAEVDRVGG
jgi:adenylate kinase family enzyme